MWPIGGSLRRGRETIGDIDIAVNAPEQEGEAICKAMARHPLTSEVIVSGAAKTSIRTTTGLQVDVRVVGAESYGAALMYFTGSKEHNVHLARNRHQEGTQAQRVGPVQGRHTHRRDPTPGGSR